MEKITLLEEEFGDIISKIERFTALSSWKFKQNIEGGEKVSVDDSGWEERSHPYWSLRDGPAYLRKWVEIPPEIEGISLDGSTVNLEFLFPSGVELFVDGRKVYNHRFWADRVATPFPLLKDARSGERHLLVFRTPTGDGIGSFWRANLQIDRVEEVLFELRCILQQIKFAINIANWERRNELKKSIKMAVDILNIEDLKQRNWRNVLSQIKEAEKALEDFRPIVKKFKIHLIGHAHIDMNWLWTYEDTIETCLRDFFTITQLMEEYPDLTFSQSQAHIYSIVEEEKPELLQKVKEKSKERRWDTTVNAWVEGDLNIVEGESIVRHILEARKYTEEKLGTTSSIMWSPDTFGHPISLPTILSDAKIKYYYFMRCGKNLPLFRWKGRDGSEVLAFNSIYNNRIDSDSILPLFIDFYNDYQIGEMMFVYGVGDHGGGPTRMDISRKRKLEEKPVTPSLQFSTTEKFFSSMEKFRSQLPVVKDELNTIFEGCYTTHSDIKKANRRCECSLLTLEVVSSVASVYGFNYPQQELQKLWRKALFNQFHDILDGSAIHAAYDYSIQLADSVEEKCCNLLQKATEYLIERGEEEGIFIFNPTGWKRDGLITSQVPDQFKGEKIHVEGADGEKIPCEVKDSRLIFKAEQIPGCGYKSFLIKKGGIEVKGKLSSRGKGRWENPFYIIEIDEKIGLIRRLYDKKNTTEVIPPCIGRNEDPDSWWAESGGNLVKVLWEKPHPMSAWVIGNIYSLENLIDVENLTIEDSPVRTVINVERRYRSSTLTQRTILYADYQYIDFELELDWKEMGDRKVGIPMVRVNFNFNMEEARPFFEIPFGVLQRKNSPREYPALKWAALREGDYWIGIINREKHGYYVDGSNLSLTVLRNPYEPDTSPDIGYQKVSYRLYFGKADELELSRRAAEFNMPLIVEREKIAQPTEFSLFKVIGDVMVTSFKKSVDGNAYILRMSEVKGTKQNLVISFSKTPANVSITNILEEEQREVKIEDSCVNLEIASYSLLTLKLRF